MPYERLHCAFEIMVYSLTASVLDSLEVAMCTFDQQDCAIAWNDYFLRFFPEHAGNIHVGEHYARNLERFYRSRLSQDELQHLDRYVQDGIRRHRLNGRAYTFTHGGRTLKVSVTTLPNGHRVRVWIHLPNGEGGLYGGGSLNGVAGASTPDALQLFELLADGVTMHDAAGRILYANDRFVNMYGFSLKEEALGRTYPQVVLDLWNTTGTPEERHSAMPSISAALVDGMQFRGVSFEIPLPRHRWMRVTVTPTSDRQTCVFHADISIEKNDKVKMHALAERLMQESHRDALTGLLNRRSLNPLLQGFASEAGPHSILFIDLDDFKKVNDSAGHRVGDDVLREISELLRRAVREHDKTVRIGGDEFVVLLRQCNSLQAAEVARKIVKSVSGYSFSVSESAFCVGASVGIRTFEGAGDSPDVLLHDADVACYEAKRLGRGRVVVFGCD